MNTEALITKIIEFPCIYNHYIIGCDRFIKFGKLKRR